MKPFSISEIYSNDHSERIIDINPLPENYCTFDCVFCPLGRTMKKTDKPHNFTETETFLDKLNKALTNKDIDLVFINPDGEIFTQSRISEIVHLIRNHHVKVRVISNGYLFNKEEYRHLLDSCDEVIGELAVTNEEDFQKLQRPLPGYTFENLLSNMSSFNSQYQGKFILDITILRNYSDTNEAVGRFQEFIQRIQPDKIFVHTPGKGKLKSAFGINHAKLQEIRTLLNVAVTTQE